MKPEKDTDLQLENQVKCIVNIQLEENIYTISMRSIYSEHTECIYALFIHSAYAQCTYSQCTHTVSVHITK